MKRKVEREKGRRHMWRMAGGRKENWLETMENSYFKLGINVLCYKWKQENVIWRTALPDIGLVYKSMYDGKEPGRINVLQA